MTMDQSKDQNKKLFQEFPGITTEQWEKVITDDLKGADYQKKLVWDTIEGFKVKPYYRAEDLENTKFTAVLPGHFPYIRGNKTQSNQWYISQEINVCQLGIEASNRKALDILNKGVDSLWFSISAGTSFTYNDFKNLLENIWTKDVEINFSAYHHVLSIIGYWKTLHDAENRPYDTLKSSLNFDPLGHLALYGNLCGCCKTSDEAFNHAAELTKEAVKFSQLKTLAVNARYFSNGGANIVQELAFALSAGVEYLSQLTGRGLSIEQLAPRIRFIFGTGSNYFFEIAKLRAARLLWAHIIKAYGTSDDDACKMNIHSVTSDWNKSIYDPYVNMLRSTTEAMSAIIGGADSLEVRPFNAIYETPTVFSERIARNQQLVLKEESNLDKIIDPAAGSYYIENLTSSIIEETWKLFLQTEEKGGYYLAMKEGFIQTAIEKTADKKIQAVANRRETILGVNQYPNFYERLSSEIDPEVYLQSEKPEGLVKPIRQFRVAAAFEELRMLTDNYSATNKRPSAFMFTYGNLAMRRARAQFACNFFAVAGFDVIDNNGFADVNSGVSAALESGAEVIVICSSDEEYAEIAIPVFEQLKDKAITVIAGNPACADDLKAAGISKFIHVRTNLLEALRQYQTELGIRK